MKTKIRTSVSLHHCHSGVKLGASSVTSRLLLSSDVDASDGGMGSAGGVDRSVGGAEDTVVGWEKKYMYNQIIQC